MTADKSAAPTSRGRPRNPAVEAAILEAALNRLATDGYARTTIGDIARDAGVTRPTIYLRWSSLHDLVIDALDLRAQDLPAIDWQQLGPVAALKAAMWRILPADARERGLGLIGHVVADAKRHPDLLEILRQRLVEPRLQELTGTLRRLQDQGLIRADLDLEAMADLCMGSYFATYLRTGDLDPAQADRVIDTLWPLLATDEGLAQEGPKAAAD